MALRLYSIAELVTSAKAIIRGIPALGTQEGTDAELAINAAARLFQGVQVGAANVYQSLVPSTADAQRRDEMVDELGLTFTKAATPARGLLAITYDAGSPGSFKLPAGSELTFPGELFPDGQERTYRLIEDLIHLSYLNPDAQFATGTGIHKVFPNRADGVVGIYDRALARISADSGTASAFAVVKTANGDDQSLDLSTPVQNDLDSTSTNRLFEYVNSAVVAAECTAVGDIGNAPRALLSQPEYPTVAVTDGSAITTELVAMIVEMGGGGAAVSEIDGDAERVVRLLEDTIACPPSLGNLQHWRELAIECPDVDLDDAVVYQHVRGPGTIDIVAIGRSGSVESTAFPGAHLEFAFGGSNTRRIGEVQAARVEAWLKSQAGYYEDVRVRSVEWDWRGNNYQGATTDAFVQAPSGLFVRITAFDGYGPDAGSNFIYTSHTRHTTNLFPNNPGDLINENIRAGQRVWATIGPATGDVRHAFATVVTEVVNVSRDGSSCSIANVAQLCPGLDERYGGELVVWRWGAAGPLTQPTLDAVFGYYDQLGPGSYLEPPRGPAYIARFHTVLAQAPAQPGYGVVRWPPEGRRWNSSVRGSEIRARLLAIEGVSTAALFQPVDTTDYLIDFEPVPFRTLALSGCIPYYG